MRALAAWALCTGLCWTQAGCNRDLRPREPPGTVPLPPPPDAGAPAPGGASGGDAGGAIADARAVDGRVDAGPAPGTSDAALPAAHQDGVATSIAINHAGCDQMLSAQRSLEGTAGTLPATGPFRPCGVLGGQSFTALAVSGDGRRVAGLGAGGQVQVLDGRTLAPIATLARARGPYESFAISVDGRVVAAGNQRDGELDIWRVDDHTLLRAVDFPALWSAAPGAVAISADGALAAASQGPDTTVVDVASGAMRQLRQTGDSSCCANALRFADGGRKLAVARFSFWAAGTGSGNVWLHDLGSGAATNLISHHDIYGEVPIDVSADGSTVLTWGGAEGIGIWDAATGARRASVPGPASLSLDLLSLNATGDEIWVLASDGGPRGGPWLQRRRSSDLSLISEMRLSSVGQPWALGPRGGMLITQTTTSDQVPQMVAVDVLTGSVLAGACMPTVGHFIQFSRDGSRLLGTDSLPTPRVIDVASGQPVGPPLDAASGNLIMSPDGRWLAWSRAIIDGTATAVVTLELAEVDTGARRTLLGQQALTMSRESLAFSPGGQLLAALNAYGGTLDVFDVSTGLLLRELALGENESAVLSFTDDGLAVRIRRVGPVFETIRWLDGALQSSWAMPAGAFGTSFDGVRGVGVVGNVANVYREGILVSSVPALLDACVGGFPAAGLSPDGSLVALFSPCSRPQSSTRMWPLIELRQADTGALIQALPFDDMVLSWDTSRLVSRATLWCR